MGTPFLCKQLSGVRQIGSKVLKNTRETSYQWAQGAIEEDLLSGKILGTHYTISGTIRVDKYCPLCSPELLQGC
jgi:hypothetical protein